MNNRTGCHSADIPPLLTKNLEFGTTLRCPDSWDFTDIPATHDFVFVACSFLKWI